MGFSAPALVLDSCAYQLHGFNVRTLVPMNLLPIGH